MVTKRIQLRNDRESLLLFGEHDNNLRQLEREYAVQIFSQQGVLAIRGPQPRVEKVMEILQSRRREILEQERHGGEPKSLQDYHNKEEEGSVYVTERGRVIKPRSDGQKKYIQALDKYDVVFGIGPAGSGKTFLACAASLAALKGGKVNRIVLTRPVVEAGEKLGYLPGDFYEKVGPYLHPLYDAFLYMLGAERFTRLKEEEIVEIVPLAYMRGRTLDDAFIILDEAQNTTQEQMKMFLTRLGSSSQVVVTGDVTQIDLADKNKSGLVQIQGVLKGVSGVKFIYFDERDIVRHELVKKIVTAYEQWEKNDVKK
ncbi:MAG: PhoH family protein [Elusimicrobiota bacterium]